MTFRVPDIPRISPLLRFHYWACKQVALWGTVLYLMGFAAEVVLGSPVKAQEFDVNVPMPPDEMQSLILDMVAEGRGPGYVLVSQGQLRKVCKQNIELWGCTVDLMGLKAVYILNTLYGARLAQAIIHEYAHAEFNWSH